jgi:hypothetical protein
MFVITQDLAIGLQIIFDLLRQNKTIPISILNPSFAPGYSPTDDAIRLRNKNLTLQLTSL